ncbi:hypothetical protein NDU88_003025 [Pleurodeles waltl]|uniref:Uncharacterized protein n=1 Tax=Pleurodeles waltl TaxID=8319 RepID=A0AAV7SEA1_PLEWA|nr:hypothetical protein NDU88_003025 [Pleurodeles waltl]
MGPGTQLGLTEHSHAGEASLDPILGALPPGRLDEKAQDRAHTPEPARALAWGLAWVPEPEPTVKAFLGSVDSQAQAP